MGRLAGKAFAASVGIIMMLSAFVVGSQQSGEGAPNQPGIAPRSSPPSSMNYVSHAPIRINSDAEFDAAHGVSNGNGTQGNPYIIENYDINGSGYGHCLYVGNTMSYFIVRNCYLHDANGYGIQLEYSTNVAILNNTISSNGKNGIYFYYSYSNRVSHNTVSYNNDSGIFILSYSNGNELDNNSIQSNKGSGIVLASNWWYDGGSTPVSNFTNCNIINYNTISSNYLDGVTLYQSGNNTITNNTISSTGGAAIQLLGCDYNHIENNIISGESEYTCQIFSTDGHYGHYCSPFVPYSTCGFMSPEAVYVPATDCTYIVYFNWSFETYIVEYNHATDTFSEPALIGVGSCYNDHCMPALSIDNNGYIYVFYGQRYGSSGQLYKKSVNPYDITQWSAQNNLGVSATYSYPQVWNYPPANKIIYIAHEYYYGGIFMTDSNNWTGSRTNLISTGLSYLISAMDSDNSCNIHLAWSYYLENGNVYYMNSSDGGKTWFAADGTFLGEPSMTGPINEYYALAFTVNDYNCKCQVISGNINFDSSGNPLIAFYAESGDANNPTCQYKLARWDDSDWVISNISYGQGHVCMLPDNDTTYRAYCVDCVNRYNLGAIGSGPLREYVSTDSGANWTYNRTIAGGATASPVRVYNAKSDKSFELTFCGGSFTGNVNAWGQNMSQGTSMSIRPIGILLDACDLRTNPDNANENYGHVQASNHNTIANNTISNTSKGIALYHGCADNAILDNNISNNDYGIGFSTYPVDNTIYHNNFINNTNQAFNVGPNQWDNGYPSGGNYWSDYTGIDVKSGPLQDQPSADGIGDTPLIIDANSRDNYPLMSPYTGGLLTFTWVNLTVHLGWNLISIPLVGPSKLPDALVDKSPQGAKVMWDRMMWWDAIDSANHWKQYYVAWNSTLNDLLDVNNTMGIWINVSSLGDGKLCLGGSEYAWPSMTLTRLYTGWNMIGYPSNYSTYTIGQFKADTGATRVETFNPYANYRTKVVSSNYIMKPGEGYWVYVPADTVWTVNW